MRLKMNVRAAAKLRESREESGLSLRELADSVGASKTHLFRIESCEAIPEEKLLRALCLELDIDFDRLCGILGRIPSDVERYIAKNPLVLRKLREEMSAA